MTKGSAPTMHVVYNGATNRRLNECSDANGNIGGCAGGGYGYDIENRLAGYAPYANQYESYGYAPDNRRVWVGRFTNGVQEKDELTYWSVTGQKLATYTITMNPYVGPPVVVQPTMTLVQTGSNVWYGGKLIQKNGSNVGTDRLGSRGRYFPYGQDNGGSNPPNDQEKFATYTRDSFSGLDYAMNRYHQPGNGRFMTADPYRASAGPSDPGSWNRYAYTRGDPTNRRDPSGLEDEFEVVDPGCFVNFYAHHNGWQWFPGGLCSLIGGPISGGGLLVMIGGQSATNDQPLYRIEEMKEVISGAVAKSSDRIASEKCAALFFAPEDNTPENRKLLSQKLLQAWDNGEIQILETRFAGDISTIVPAFVNDDNNIVIIEGRSFFTGLLNGQPLGGAFSGLNLSEIQQLMLIHEFIHKTGLIGRDDGDQTYVLANGKKVTGTVGVSQAVREACF